VESVLEQLERGSRVAVVRLRSLGDCVLTTPALEILKRSRPDLQVAVVVEDRFRELFEGNPDVDQILPPERGAVRSWRPRLCMNFHGGKASAWLAVNSGARFRAGFAHFRLQRAYNVLIPRAQEILGVDRVVHTAEHLASAVFYLGVEQCEIPRAKLVAVPKPPAPRTPVAVIHPTASSPDKTWLGERFLAVAEHLKNSGFEPVFIDASPHSLARYRAFRTLCDAPLREIKQLLSTASLFIGNDSGPAHMAGALGLPTVVLFGSSDPAIWGPWRTPCEVLGPGDIMRIEVRDVIDALSRLRVHA
jgi:ADP-heptose:LPS heptosyltransferase